MNLHAHHIVPQTYVDDIYEKENLVSLCESCHGLLEGTDPRRQLEIVGMNGKPIDYSVQCRFSEFIRKMIRNRISGDRNISSKDVSTMLSERQWLAEKILEDMVSDPDAPVEGYGGGHRDNVRLTDVSAAVDYLKRHGGNVPFGFD